MKITIMFFITNLSARHARALIRAGSVLFQTDKNFRKRNNPKIPKITVIPEIKMVRFCIFKIKSIIFSVMRFYPSRQSYYIYFMILVSVMGKIQTDGININFMLKSITV